MKRISRRSFLIASGLALPAASIAALTRQWDSGDVVETLGTRGGLVIPELPTPGPPLGNEDRMRTVQGGFVVSIDGDEITIADSKGEETRLLTSEDTVQDDGYWVSSLPIELGDKITARGLPIDAGQFSVAQLYVNAKFYYGPILEVIDVGPALPIRFRIQDRYDLSPYHEQQPDGHVVRIDPRTLIAGPLPDPRPTQNPYNVPQDVAANVGVDLKVGQHVEVVGREYHGELYAIRLML